MAEDKENLFDKILDLFRDDEEEAEKAAAEKAAAEKEAAEAAELRRSRLSKRPSTAKPTKRATPKKPGGSKRAQVEKAALAAKPKTGVVDVRSLRIRQDHTTESPEVGELKAGERVTILKVWTDGKNIWGNLGPDKWSAILYEGMEMIKLD